MPDTALLRIIFFSFTYLDRIFILFTISSGRSPQGDSERRTELPASLHIPQTEEDVQDTLDAPLSSEEDNDCESVDSFSNYEEDLHQGLESEEVQHLLTL